MDSRRTAGIRRKKKYVEIETEHERLAAAVVNAANRILIRAAYERSRGHQP